MKANPSLLLLLLLSPYTVRAQTPFVQTIDPFRVERGNGSVYRTPFSGGLVAPRIALRDADSDGDPDLFVLNPDYRLRYYRNEGNLRFRRLFPSPFDSAPVYKWFRFADLDNDGDDDLLTAGGVSEILHYRNFGSTPVPAWSTPADTLRHDGTNIIRTEQETVPALVDIDADGDLDLFSGNIEGSITYYRNDGTAAVPAFVRVSGKYEDILVISGRTREKNKGSEIQSGSRHGASVLDFMDIDGDDDLDILFGDFFTPRLLLFYNDGTPTAADYSMSRLDTAFEGMGDIVSSGGFNQGVPGDIDVDGDLDLIVSSLLLQSPFQPLTLFENTGSRTAPTMRRREVDLTDEIDLGGDAAPAIISDSERNGLLVGTSDGSITYFSSRIEDGRTVWRQERRYSSIPNLFNAIPTAGDIDGDGRSEILVGGADQGTITMFRFQGDRLQPAPWQLDTFPPGRYAAPTLVDLEGDGDLDLFIGGENGRFTYFQNTGTPTTPLFVRTPPPSPFESLDVGYNSVPRFFDLDRDGDLDVTIGARPRPDDTGGVVRFYLNTGGSFSTTDFLPDITTDRNPVPLPARLMEGLFLFLGERAGGLTAYFDPNSSSVETGTPQGGSIVESLVIHRNGERLVLGGNIIREGTSIVMFDLLGRKVLQTQIIGANGLALPPLPAGVYVLGVGAHPSVRLLLLP